MPIIIATITFKKYFGMKKKVLFLTIILSIFSINIVNGQGWKKFRNVLKKEFNGLTPYSIPDVNYSPGSVLLIYSKNEQLYASRALQFPTLTLQPPSPIPSTKIVKVSQISFDVNADSQIIPNELTEVAKLGYDSKSTFNFGMKKAQKHQIEIGPLELLINNLDITNTKDKLLLEKLTNENCVVVAQALFVNGMTFSFKRQNKINADIKANITKAATNANLKLNILNDYEFTLESDTSIYYAFDIYHKNTDQLKKLYEDKKKIVELKQKKEDNIADV